MFHQKPESNICPVKEAGGTLIGEDGLMVMAGAESVEWYQIYQTHGFHVFDAIPFTPVQPLLSAILSSAAFDVVKSTKRTACRLTVSPAKHPHNITPPLPCFTVGNTHVEIIRSPFIRLTKTHQTKGQISTGLMPIAYVSWSKQVSSSY